VTVAASGHPPIPGPRGLPVLGSLPQFRKSVVLALMNGWREHGDVVRFRGPLSVISIAHPDHVQYILRDNAANYRHPDFEINKLKPTFRNGLVTSQGEFWRRQRTMMQPAFHRDLVDGFARMMAQTAEAMVDRWRPGSPMDMRVEMQRMTLNVLTNALFTADWATEAEAVMTAVTVANEHTNKRLLAPVDLPEWVPLPAIRRFVRTRQTVDDMVYGLISERRASGEDRGDLLSLLMAARDEEGRGMSDEELHDELISMIFAGHETVSVCLAWTWYLLSQDAAAARRLEEEVDGVLEGRSPTLDDTKRMPFTWSVLQEALRLYPPIWLIPRTPIEDDEVGGYRLRAGEMLFLAPYVTHRHTEFYDDPEAFDPSRFEPEKTKGWHRFQYYPFGGGPRKCLGHEFAMLEMLIIVAVVVQRFRLALVPGHPVAPQPMVTLRPQHGVPMNLERRGNGGAG
jgi:cytochrome P450